MIKFQVILLTMFFVIVVIGAAPLYAFQEPTKPCMTELSIMTGHDLGTAWRTAHWRKGIEPNRYYNSEALDRVMADEDLGAVALQWAALSRFSNDRELMDQTYQYLVGLGDLRIKYDLPRGGSPEAPKPMLQYLKLVLSNAASGKHDMTTDKDFLTELNDRFFHIEHGFSPLDADHFREFLIQHLNPRLSSLGIVY